MVQPRWRVSTDRMLDRRSGSQNNAGTSDGSMDTYCGGDGRRDGAIPGGRATPRIDAMEDDGYGD